MTEPKIGLNTGNRGKGRPKGVPNKTTAALKDMILQALHENGGVAYLSYQAQSDPKAFMALLGRVLPLQVNGAGDQGQHVHEVLWRVKEPGD